MAEWVKAPRVAIIDDSPQQVEVLRRLLAAEGYECVVAADGASGLTVCLTGVDVVLLDVRLPDMDGLTLCRLLKATPATALTPVLIMTGHGDDATLREALESGADDFLSKPIRAPHLRARIRSAARTKLAIDELDSVAASMLALGATVEARDWFTVGHCQRVAQYASRLGARLGLPPEDLTALERGGYLHDIGKVGIPDALLLKPGPLTPEEYEVVKTHAVLGEQICAPLTSLRLVRPIIRHHHETLDGGGYPDGLKGSAVPLLAQITGIVDVFDALTTDRPYRRPVSPGAALDVLRNEAAVGRRDITLVEEFARVIGEGIAGPTA